MNFVYFSGLHLNSFIPHFEPLYYDRQLLVEQYRRLKQSQAVKKAKNDEHNQQLVEHQQVLQKAQEKRKREATTRARTSRRRRRDTSLVILPSTSSSTTEDSDGDDLLSSGPPESLNLSTASTTAFFRHNCPMPNIEHDHNGLLEDITEKVLQPKPTAAQLLTSTLDVGHSTEAADSSDRWLLYGDRTDADEVERMAEEVDPDTDASIDIVEEGEEEEPSESVVLNSRSADGHGGEEHIRVEFTAHNRLFRLRLHSNSERVFAPDVVIEMADGRPISYDMSNVVRGHLEGKTYLDVFILILRFLCYFLFY